MYNQLPKRVELYLQGKAVGEVELNRFADSWHFGNFHPNRAFSEFAPLFGEWSLLLHADERAPEASRAALDELGRIEVAIDALRAEVFLPETGQRLPVDQVNIDGDMIELKLADQPH